MIVTIDGPAGAGKSTIARGAGPTARLSLSRHRRHVSRRGAGGDARGLDWNEPAKLVESGPPAPPRGERRPRGDRRPGRDAREIRSSEVTAATHYAANNPGVREHLVELQRQAAGDDDIVTEGRDQGTVVFPQAECKIYLTASPEERARRRAQDLAGAGRAGLGRRRAAKPEPARPQRRQPRASDRWWRPSDAVEVPTDGLTPDQVLDRLEALVRERMPTSAPKPQSCAIRLPSGLGSRSAVLRPAGRGRLFPHSLSRRAKYVPDDRRRADALEPPEQS